PGDALTGSVAELSLRLGDRLLDDGEPLAHELRRHDDRRGDAEDVPGCRPCQATAKGRLVDVVPGLDERLARRLVLHQLDGEQRAATAHLADDRMTLGHRPHRPERVLAELPAVSDEVVVPDDG